MHVKWKTQLSDKFTDGNGVRQGSVLFPSFFDIYTEDLLVRLKNCEYGAGLGPAFVGCLANADDVPLISPTVNGTQRMNDICTSFETKNSTARKLCYFVRQESEDLIFYLQLAIDGCILPFKSIISHLGVSMDLFLQARHMVEARIRKFFEAVNTVLRQIDDVFRSDKVWLKIVT